MPFTKTDHFTPQQHELAAIAKVLSHPARIAILEVLLNQEYCVNGDIGQLLSLSPETVAEHLKELKTAGLIRGTIEGSAACFCIEVEIWNRNLDLLIAFFGKLNLKKSFC